MSEVPKMVFLDCGENHELLDDPYLMELARGLQEALLNSGYGPVLNASRGTLQSLVASDAITASSWLSNSSGRSSRPR